MSIVILFLIIIAVIVTLFFVEEVNAELILDTNKSQLTLTARWLPPVLKALVSIQNSSPVLTIYFFALPILKKTLKKGKKGSSKIELFNALNPTNIDIRAYYGSLDPQTTGIICGVINFASQFINIESLMHCPDFLPQDDYIYLDATAKINLGKALINLLKQKTNRRKQLWSKTQT